MRISAFGTQTPFALSEKQPYTKTNLTTAPPLERAVEKYRFEVLRKRVFERFDASESRVTFSPQIGIFQRAFERNRVAFSLDTFFWQSKRKYLAKGETFVKRLCKFTMPHYHYLLLDTHQILY